jgi:hypothetical protein
MYRLRDYAHAGVQREAAVAVGQHLFGIETLQQTPPDKAAQDAFAQAGLGLGHHFAGDTAGRVEDDTLRTDLRLRISIALARYWGQKCCCAGSTPSVAWWAPATLLPAPKAVGS